MEPSPAQYLAACIAPPRVRRSPWAILLRIVAGVAKTLVALHVAYLVLTTFLLVAYRYIDPPATLLMPYRALRYGWTLKAPVPKPLKAIPPYLRRMLISVEDDKFYQHNGIDIAAFKRAQEINKRVGKPLYGGSTLTMQVARTLFLVPEKSYIRKYLEVLTALEMELILGKNRILELYFGYAEWGKGIFGIEAAAQHWYKVDVGALTRDQGARLIALLSSPIRFTPSTLHTSGILKARYAYLAGRSAAAPVRDAAASIEDAAASAATPPPPGDVIDAAVPPPVPADPLDPADPAQAVDPGPTDHPAPAVPAPAAD